MPGVSCWTHVVHMMGWMHCALQGGVACTQVADKGPIGLCQHPHRNLVATWATEGVLNLWKAA